MKIKILKYAVKIHLMLGTKNSDDPEGVFCLSRPYSLKFFKGRLAQILLRPLLNTLSHLFRMTINLFLGKTS